MKLKPEEIPIDTNNKSNRLLHSKWVKDGCIEFKNVSLRYTETGDRILKSLNFKINAGEKIAVCGRTGTVFVEIR